MTDQKKYRRLSKEDRKMVVALWTSGAAKTPELAQTYDVCKKTIRNTLSSAGVWPGVDDHTAKPDTHRNSVIQKEIDAAPQQVRDCIEYNRVASQGRLKTFRPLVEMAVELHGRGFSYEEIGRNFHCSRALVQNWITYDRMIKAQEAKAKIRANAAPEAKPTLVPTGTIELIRAPKRSLLDRIKDFFN